MQALIVDDEAAARRRLAGVLRQVPSLRIEECANGRSALGVLRRRPPDLLFLDVRMPDLSGFDVLAQAATEQRSAVILVTAFEEYAVQAFASHVFDYLLKPFDDERVLETVRRATMFLDWLRRGAGVLPDRFGDVRIDYETHRVYRGDAIVPLRPKEFALLRALLRGRGRVLTRLELLREVWGYADDAETRTVDTHMSRLRRRLERDPARPRHILTVRALGYRVQL